MITDRSLGNNWIVLLHGHPLVGNVLVNEFREDKFLINTPLLGYAKIDVAVFSMSSAPSNSRTTILCNPFLSNGTVNTSAIIGVFRGVCAECL
jgi:hypothetical protein